MNSQKLWFILVPIFLFAMLAVTIEAGISAGFEGWAYRRTIAEMSPGFTAVMKGVTHLGDSYVVIGFCLILFVPSNSRRSLALPVSEAVILSAALNLLLKNIFARERPDILRLIAESGYSFPSGHAMINASLYTMLILLIRRDARNSRIKGFLTAVCTVLPLLIGFSRVYLGVHYAGDVLGGWLFGFAVSMFVYWIISGDAGKFIGRRIGQKQIGSQQKRK